MVPSNGVANATDARDDTPGLNPLQRYARERPWVASIVLGIGFFVLAAVQVGVGGEPAWVFAMVVGVAVLFVLGMRLGLHYDRWRYDRLRETGELEVALQRPVRSRRG
jgi:uncharacterized membrane protein YhaH (DUF805 family)